MSEKLVGECQICQRTHKLRGKLLVLHGYQRPGHGYITGECPGVGFEPYELSCARCVSFLDWLLKKVETTNARHDSLIQGTASIRVYFDKRYPSNLRLEPTRIADQAREIEPQDEEYENLRRQAEHATARKLDRMVLDVGYYTARVENWKPRPLRTVVEYEKSEQAKKRGPVGGLSQGATKLMRATAQGVRSTFVMDDLLEVLDALGWIAKRPTWVSAPVRDTWTAERVAERFDLGQNWSSGEKGWLEVLFEPDQQPQAQDFYERVLALSEKPFVPGRDIIGFETTKPHQHLTYVGPPGSLSKIIVPVKMMGSVQEVLVITPGGDHLRVRSRLGPRGNVAAKVQAPTFWRDAYKAGLQKHAADWLGRVNP